MRPHTPHTVWIRPCMQTSHYVPPLRIIAHLWPSWLEALAKMRSSWRMFGMMMGQQRCKCRFIVANRRVLNPHAQFSRCWKTWLIVHAVHLHPVHPCLCHWGIFNNTYIANFLLSEKNVENRTISGEVMARAWCPVFWLRVYYCYLHFYVSIHWFASAQL